DDPEEENVDNKRIETVGIDRRVETELVDLPVIADAVAIGIIEDGRCPEMGNLLFGQSAALCYFPISAAATTTGSEEDRRREKEHHQQYGHAPVHGLFLTVCSGQAGRDR